MATVEVDGLRIAYERAGEGPPVVLVHGYLGDGPSTWRLQLDELADEFTVVAWDAPGAGASADPPQGFGMAGYADCLAGFIDVVGLGAPHVVGLSFGGALALELCRRHPAVPATLTLVSAYAGWIGSLGREAAEHRLRQAHLLAGLPPDELVEALLPTMFGRATPSGVVKRFGASMQAFHPAGFRAMADASAEDLRAALPCVRVPTLVISGDHDVRAPRRVAEDLHAGIPGSTLVVLRGAGHICNAEAPEAFNGALRGFLRSHPTSA